MLTHLALPESSLRAEPSRPVLIFAQHVLKGTVSELRPVLVAN